MLPSWHDAEDVIQETKIQLWREFDKFQDGSDFAAWARTIARYSVLTHVKRQRRGQRLLSDDVVEAVMAKLAKNPAETDRRLEILAGCVKRLSGDALDLLRRCYIDRQKIKTIAKELNRSLAGTYSSISRIRRELVTCVRQRMHQEDES